MFRLHRTVNRRASTALRSILHRHARFEQKNYGRRFLTNKRFYSGHFHRYRPVSFLTFQYHSPSFFLVPSFISSFSARGLRTSFALRDDEITVVVPFIADSISEGEIGEYSASIGAQVLADQPIVVIETDKASVDVPAPASGTIVAHLAEEGDVVQVGDPLLKMVAGVVDAEDVAATADVSNTATVTSSFEDKNDAKESSDALHGGRIPMISFPARRDALGNPLIKVDITNLGKVLPGAPDVSHHEGAFGIYTEDTPQKYLRAPMLEAEIWQITSGGAYDTEDGA